VEGKLTVVYQTTEFIGKDELGEDMFWHLLAIRCSSAGFTETGELRIRNCIVIPTGTPK
jgi:hypothetical protein